MFHKLRIKLTLINSGIILLLFLLLIIGTYYFSSTEIANHSASTANRLAQKIKTGMIHDLAPHDAMMPFNDEPFRGDPPPPNNNAPPRDQPPGGFRPPMPPFGPSFFFVKLSPTDAITFKSSNQPLPDKELATLVRYALQDKNIQGKVLLEIGEFHFFKSSIDNDLDSFILFQDFAQENSMLRIQLTALLIVGLVCLILSCFGSFFMANWAMKPIKKAWQQQKDFLSDASHELRTPLAVIQTNLDVVLGNLDETVVSQYNWLQNIQEESVQMANLVDSLLLLARTDSNQQLLNKQVFSFTDTLMQAFAAFDPVASARGLSLELDIKTPITACGDEMRIKQVINILLDNAIRHTPKGGKVSLQLSRNNNVTLLRVADTGEGIAPEYLGKIFDRFYQVDKARSNGGAGLGLAIAKWVVESHGGTISVTSKPHFGTTFTTQFPF